MWLSGILATAGTGSAVAGMAWVSRRLRWVDGADLIPTVGAVTSALIFFFFGTLAFLIVSTTQCVSAAEQATAQEAGALRDAYLSATWLPADQARTVEAALTGYTRTVVDVEWPLMERNQVSPQAWTELDALRFESGVLIGADAASDARTKQATADIHKALDAVYQQRRVRVADVRAGAPTMIVAGVIGAGAVSVLFPLLVGWPRGRRYVAALGVLGAVMGFGVWLVLQINHPFGSGIRVAPTAFNDALARFASIEH
ncbi:hypothetical protein GCM10009839_07490 [Catenulispora yoronensis]|uniref:DUF4239 domain-containing protein n=1 Tax=Catenulispora yoronensis TaxID=450799 RepID=A0ABN2TNY3_9ACTN